jgi:hypothetical protein
MEGTLSTLQLGSVSDKGIAFCASPEITSSLAPLAPPYLLILGYYIGDLHFPVLECDSSRTMPLQASFLPLPLHRSLQPIFGDGIQGKRPFSLTSPNLFFPFHVTSFTPAISFI